MGSNVTRKKCLRNETLPWRYGGGGGGAGGERRSLLGHHYNLIGSCFSAVYGRLERSLPGEGEYLELASRDGEGLLFVRVVVYSSIACERLVNISCCETASRVHRLLIIQFIWPPSNGRAKLRPTERMHNIVDKNETGLN